MLTKAQAKYIQNLGHKKLRENENLFVAEGPKLVLELLDEPLVTLHTAYATKSFLAAHPELHAVHAAVIAAEEPLARGRAIDGEPQPPVSDEISRHGKVGRQPEQHLRRAAVIP